MRSLFHIVLGALVGAALTAAVLLPWSSGEDENLEAAWHSFMQGVASAQQSLTNPKHFPPEATDRNLAEGHRYLLAHLSRMIEMEFRQHPRFPEFNRSMDMLRKWTGENPDTMYLKAPIDGEGYYRVEGSSVPGRAPRMVTFATITSVPGDTGDLREMANCRNQTLDFITGVHLGLEASGNFSFLVGPERPSDYEGHFLQSSKVIECSPTGESSQRTATFLSVREIFSDWEREVPVEMEITRLDAIGENRPPLTSAEVAAKLQKMGRELPNQVVFWQQLQEVALEINRDINLDGKRSMPVNDINQPALPFTAAGVAGAMQLYAAGIFEFNEDQALVVKVTAPLEPRYIGFQLSNLWFEGPDQQNYVSSLTGSQLPVASDGSRYYIVAHRDPGLQGWVDTTGLEKGTHAMRFIFDDDPPAEQLPTATATLVSFADIADYVPADTPVVSVEERRAEIAIRQSHIKRRWRGH